MEQTQLEGAPDIPEGLMKLPVTKQIGTIDFGLQNFVARAATGSGKTMMLPAYEALMRKRAGKKGCVAIRVPTKVVGGFVTSGLRHFWEPLGLKVAILNRDVDAKEEKAVGTADLVIISDGSLNRLMKLNEVGAFYPDEAHWLSLNAELDIAIAKKKGIPLRFLSATIDEKLFIDYLGPATGNYLLEGRTFPIRKHVIWSSPDVFKRDAHDELYTIIQGAAYDLKKTGESAIVFLPTRQMCEDAAAFFLKHIPTTFVHGGVSPVEAEAWTKKHAGSPYIVFATTAAAVGITLDLHRAYIADEIIDSVVERGMERMQTGAMDDNMVLQAAGRAGRIREGDAYLITHEQHRDPRNGDPWLNIKPRPIKPPAEKATPFEVKLAMAQHGIVKDEDLDLLSNLRTDELKHAHDWLVRHHCLNQDGTLTRMGKYVASFPMSTQYAHLVLSTRCRKCTAGEYNDESRCTRCTKAKLAVLAGFTIGLGGTFTLLKVKPRTRQLEEIRQTKPDWPLFPKDLLVKGSVPMTLAKLMQRAVSLDNSEMFAWANANNFWAKPLFAARKDFMSNADYVLSDGAKRALLAMKLDDPELIGDVHAHLKRHPLYTERILFGTTDERNPPGFFDSVFADCFGMNLTPRHWRCWSIPKLISKPRFKLFGLEMAFVEPEGEHPEDEDIETKAEEPKQEDVPVPTPRIPPPPAVPFSAKADDPVEPAADGDEEPKEAVCDTCEKTDFCICKDD